VLALLGTASATPWSQFTVSDVPDPKSKGGRDQVELPELPPAASSANAGFWLKTKKRYGILQDLPFGRVDGAR